MAKSKGIDTHPLFKLGKANARHDERNLKLASILRAPVRLPASYDFDVNHPDIPLPMFANDRLGNCVIAGRAHQTLRFEKVEQNIVIQITENDVIKEYFKQTGGPDSGLIVLASLKLWRKSGWNVGKKRYKIKAFTEIAKLDHEEVKRAIFIDLGVGLGLRLPRSAQRQFQTGQIWEVARGSGSLPNSWGGHYVYCAGYTPIGPVCVTWGRKQQMTWEFLDTYCDEAYGIIDAVNTPKKVRGLNAKALDQFLAGL
jgi:hypothetical protein